MRLILFGVPYLIIGHKVLRKAALNLKNGRVFDENFLMTVATLAAFAIGEYTEALAVMIFYQIGEYFQSYAVGKSRQSIKDLMSIVPAYANKILPNGTMSQEDPEDIAVGDVIAVLPGERVPLDGVVLSGTSFLDTSSLTGESVPRRVGEGDDVISGCINTEGSLQVQVTKLYEDSTVARILDLVENASNKKARSEQFITRFARYYTPVVTLLALLLAVLPPLILHVPFSAWIRRACVFLIVSCPCALVISVPLSFFGGIGAAARRGILVKGSTDLETMAGVTTVVFDKTGTLTLGTFTVTGLYPLKVTEEALLETAAYAECFSTHPIAASIRDAYAQPIDTLRVRDVTEEAGHGVCAVLDGHPVLVGSKRLLQAHDVDVPDMADLPAGTICYVASDGVCLGCLVISDTCKDGAEKAIRRMKALGVARCVMLTGDRLESAQAVAKETGIDAVYAELLPADKVSTLETLMDEKVAFVGDGVNDAPVLMRADCGIAMGSLGSDAAIEAADIVLMDDDLNKIAVTIDIARKTLRIVRQNIVFAIGVKLLVLLLGATGVASMWLAVFADVGVAVIAILNAMRLLTYRS